MGIINQRAEVREKDLDKRDENESGREVKRVY